MTGYKWAAIILIVMHDYHMIIQCQLYWIWLGCPIPAHLVQRLSDLSSSCFLLHSKYPEKRKNFKIKQPNVDIWSNTHCLIDSNNQILIKCENVMKCRSQSCPIFIFSSNMRLLPSWNQSLVPWPPWPRLLPVIPGAPGPFIWVKPRHMEENGGLELGTSSIKWGWVKTCQNPGEPPSHSWVKMDVNNPLKIWYFHRYWAIAKSISRSLRTLLS